MLRSAVPFDAAIDGYDSHPVDEIEPIFEGRGYRQICEDLMQSMNNCLLSIIENGTPAKAIGSLWGIASYRDNTPAEVPLEIDLEELRNEPSLSSAYFRMLPQMAKVVSFIAEKPNEAMAAYAVGAQLGMEFCEGLSLEAMGEKFGVGRAAMSAYVREFQRRGGNEYTSDYQKPESSRSSYRESRYRYLENQRRAASS